MSEKVTVRVKKRTKQDEQREERQKAIEKARLEQLGKELLHQAAIKRRVRHDEEEETELTRATIALGISWQGCTAGYNIEQMAAIARANKMSYGGLQRVIGCNYNALPEGMIIPDFTEFGMKSRGRKADGGLQRELY